MPPLTSHNNQLHRLLKRSSHGTTSTTHPVQVPNALSPFIDFDQQLNQQEPTSSDIDPVLAPELSANNSSYVYQPPTLPSLSFVVENSVTPVADEFRGKQASLGISCFSSCSVNSQASADFILPWQQRLRAYPSVMSGSAPTRPFTERRRSIKQSPTSLTDKTTTELFKYQQFHECNNNNRKLENVLSDTLTKPSGFFTKSSLLRCLTWQRVAELSGPLGGLRNVLATATFFPPSELSRCFEPVSTTAPTSMYKQSLSSSDTCEVNYVHTPAQLDIMSVGVSARILESSSLLRTTTEIDDDIKDGDGTVPASAFLTASADFVAEAIPISPLVIPTTSAQNVVRKSVSRRRCNSLDIRGGRRRGCSPILCNTSSTHWTVTSSATELAIRTSVFEPGDSYGVGSSAFGDSSDEIIRRSVTEATRRLAKKLFQRDSRSSLELDTLLDCFSKAKLRKMTLSELKDYELLLAMDNWSLFSVVSCQIDIPDDMVNNKALTSLLRYVNSSHPALSTSVATPQRAVDSFRYKS